MAELLITFRETLEAALIVGILYTFISKTGKMHLKASIQGGVIAALAASVVFAIIFQLILGGFSGRAEEIFEGTVMILAAVLLSTMIIWMARNKNISENLENQASAVMDSNKNVAQGLFALAFLSVFREGIETVLFLYGIYIKDGGLSFATSLTGVAIAIALGYAIFIQGKKVPLKTFFNVTSILLIFVAAGLVAYGIHEFEEAGLIYYPGPIWDVNPALNPDGSYPLFHEKGGIGVFAKGLFGWNGNPSAIEVMAYFLTLVGVSYMWSAASAKQVVIAKDTVSAIEDKCPTCFEEVDIKSTNSCGNCNTEL